MKNLSRLAAPGNNLQVADHLLKWLGNNLGAP